ncbi:TRAP transporter substrate-binding protein [Rhodoligotrophos defluvii]|uniref:TRAP transporter substrate-binding protein n=1 Tax=Rhodoligotrophos defluvii TaxID=2561934 RepID=UPI0010C935A8|nr:TRAP transporter substrate-binding protein [Rhodoligotrophos defluvii]
MKKLSSCIVALAALLATSAAAPAQEVSLRAATIGAPGGIQDVALQKFKEVAEERSGGRIGVTIYTGGALGDQDANMEAMQSGTLDIATIETPITVVDPLLGVFALPYMFADRAHVAAVLNGEIGEEVRERLVEQGLRPIGYYEAGFRQMTNNVRPINKPEDLKGIKMRTPGSKLRIKIFNAWGANAAPLPFPELYTALQTGAFDGQENPLVEVQSSRFYEVQKYLSLTNHIYQPGFLLMSEQRYQQLPEDLKQVVVEAAKEAGVASVAFGEKGDTEIVALVREKGMEVNEADMEAFKAASQQIWEEETAELGEEAADLIKRIQAARPQ